MDRSHRGRHLPVVPGVATGQAGWWAWVGPAVGGRCPRNRRGNRATACNQNTGCGHDGGQCHNPRHPVFLHEPHWPPACAPGKPIQPDCPIKTVSGISQHRRQGQRRGWPISWTQPRRWGVLAHWDAPLTMPAGQLWRSVSPVGMNRLAAIVSQVSSAKGIQLCWFQLE